MYLYTSLPVNEFFWKHGWFTTDFFLYANHIWNLSRSGDNCWCWQDIDWVNILLSSLKLRLIHNFYSYSIITLNSLNRSVKIREIINRLTLSIFLLIQVPVFLNPARVRAYREFHDCKFGMALHRAKTLQMCSLISLKSWVMYFLFEFRECAHPFVFNCPSSELGANPTAFSALPSGRARASSRPSVMLQRTTA